MGTWKIQLKAVICDEMEVEAETEEEAIKNASRDWRFVEAAEWETEVIDRPDEEDDDEADS